MPLWTVMDQDSSSTHSTHSSVSAKEFLQVNIDAQSFLVHCLFANGFTWLQSYFAMLLMPQNFTKCLEILLFLYNLHSFAPYQTKERKKATKKVFLWHFENWEIFWDIPPSVLAEEYSITWRVENNCTRKYFKDYKLAYLSRADIICSGIRERSSSKLRPLRNR